MNLEMKIYRFRIFKTMQLGIDKGSLYIKVVLMEWGKIVYSKRERLTDFVPEKIANELLGFGTSFRVGVSRELNTGIPVRKVESISALSRGISFLFPGAGTVVEVGAKTSKMVRMENGRVVDFMTNDLCASGTGLFIETQAKRLGLSLEEFSRMGVEAGKPARVAGRCAVFAKSDMVHLQQKGVPLPEIVYGLFVAIAKNLLSILGKGREIKFPLVLAGGCAENPGLLKAFKEVLRDERVFPSPLPGMEIATGCALEAEKGEKLKGEDVIRLLHEMKASRKPFLTLLPLKQKERKRLKEPDEIFESPQEGYIGIDVGSVSTDVVVINREGKLLSAVYLPTAGKPADVVIEGLNRIKERFRGGLNVLGCGATGSGRYLAGKLVNADVIKNEISAQMKGTLFYFPDADTIFEIGGQDSKFISVEGGKLRDFSMNKICAAGTGSFIEEQALLLDMDVRCEFSKTAFSSKNPVDFGSRCTVFMESAISEALESERKEDIIAGIAFSVVRNYLEKVAGKKKIGKKIVFQGGVASNDAVVSAFEELLGKEISVHPYNRLSGAIGIALIAKERVKNTTFRWPEEKVRETRRFECKRCSNSCEVTVINTDERKLFFGDVCERYTSGKSTKEGKALPDLQDDFWRECEKYIAGKGGGIRVGIPRASFFIHHLPFWASLLSSLGFEVHLSPPSSEETLKAGMDATPVPFCMPVKLFMGHISILKKDVDLLFLPSITSLGEGKSYLCPYTIALPFFTDKRGIISPTLSFRKKELVEEIFISLKNFGITRKSVEDAIHYALAVQKDFEESLRKKGEMLLKRNYKKALLLGRPYTVFDSFANLRIFSHLISMEILPVPYNYVPVEEKGENSFPWFFPDLLYRVLSEAVKYERVYPVILSQFGCGVDGFSHKFFEESIKDLPHLFIEFDEHRGEAGMITRLEAFCDLIEEKEKGGAGQFYPLIRKKTTKPDREKKIFIPYFADHVFAFSGALKYAGFKHVEVLPPPDEERKKKGERFADGKECHPYSILLGDLITLCEKKEEGIFFFPGTSLPCLLQQYGDAMNLLLVREGVKGIEVVTPLFKDFLEILGMKGAERLYKGLLAIDILLKAVAFTRPFERKKGEVNRIHLLNLREIEKGIAFGDVLGALRECIQRLEETKGTSDGNLPIIGVAGDIYTRINPFANFNLPEYIEKKGAIALPSPFETDIIDFGLFRSFHEAMGKLNLKALIPSGILLIRREIEVRKFIKGGGRVAKRFSEPSFSKIRELAEKYVWNAEHELIYLNTSKMAHFAELNLDGIINATCFNCMVGHSSWAILEKIRKDTGIPAITLVYSNILEPSTLSLLDAFIEQVREKNARK